MPVQPFFPGSPEQLFIPLTRDAIAIKPLSFPLAIPAPVGSEPRVSPQAPCPAPQDLLHLDPYCVDPPVPIFCLCSANMKKKPRHTCCLTQACEAAGPIRLSTQDRDVWDYVLESPLCCMWVTLIPTESVLETLTAHLSTCPQSFSCAANAREWSMELKRKLQIQAPASWNIYPQRTEFQRLCQASSRDWGSISSQDRAWAKLIPQGLEKHIEQGLPKQATFTEGPKTPAST